MQLIAEPSVLAALGHALLQPASHPSAAAGATLAAGIATSGWADLDELRGLLLEQDHRLSGIPMQGLVDLLGLGTRTVFRRPRRLSDAPLGFEKVAAADAAYILITLERMGFTVSPMTLISHLIPGIQERAFVTNEELLALDYAKSRGRMTPLVLTARGAPSAHERTTLQTRRKYRVTVDWDADGQPVAIEAHAPRHRPEPAPVFTACEVCGTTYLKGSADDERAHRRAHAAAMAVLEPKPDRRFFAALDRAADPYAVELVTADSPAWQHQLMHARALLFKREFRYDLVQWAMKETDPDACGFLFLDDTGTYGRGAVVGACAFRAREDGWAMQWIWQAPGVRRKGILRRRWPTYRRLFGEFALEPPLSGAMDAFAARHASPRQRRHEASGAP